MDWQIPTELLIELKQIHPDIRPIPDYFGYWITPTGNVYCILPWGQSNKPFAPHPRLRKTKWHRNLEQVNLFDENSQRHTLSIAWLLLVTFVSPPKGDVVASFVDGNTHNYALDNLAWKTRSDVFKRTYQIHKGQVRWGAKPLDQHIVSEIKRLRAQGWSMVSIHRRLKIGYNTTRKYAR